MRFRPQHEDRAGHDFTRAPFNTVAPCRTAWPMRTSATSRTKTGTPSAFFDDDALDIGQSFDQSQSANNGPFGMPLQYVAPALALFFSTASKMSCRVSLYFLSLSGSTNT